jgi:hypothetical protein
VRIEAHCSFDERKTFCRPPRLVQDMAQAATTLGVVRVERQAPPPFGNRLIVLVAPQVDPAEEHVGEGRLVVERHASLR